MKAHTQKRNNNNNKNTPKDVDDTSHLTIPQGGKEYLFSAISIPYTQSSKQQSKSTELTVRHSQKHWGSHASKVKIKKHYRNSERERQVEKNSYLMRGKFSNCLGVMFLYISLKYVYRKRWIKTGRDNKSLLVTIYSVVAVATRALWVLMPSFATTEGGRSNSFNTLSISIIRGGMVWLSTHIQLLKAYWCGCRVAKSCNIVNETLLPNF